MPRGSWVSDIAHASPQRGSPGRIAHSSAAGAARHVPDVPRRGRSTVRVMKLIALVLVAACSSSAPRPATVAPVTASAATASRPFAVTVTGHGPPVILIPGLASSGDVWKSTVAHLANSYTCHVL